MTRPFRRLLESKYWKWWEALSMTPYIRMTLVPAKRWKKQLAFNSSTQIWSNIFFTWPNIFCSYSKKLGPNHETDMFFGWFFFWLGGRVGVGGWPYQVDLLLNDVLKTKILHLLRERVMNCRLKNRWTLINWLF